MTEEVKTRYNFIDIAKGICMISILLGHLGLDSINRVVFTYHIPVFYLIAGYFLKEDEPLSSFIKKKFRSLIIPYIIASVLIIISAVIMNLIYAQGEGLFSLVKDWCFAALYGAGDSYEKPFHTRGIGAIWFLLALFWGELFLKLILKCNPHVRPFIVALLVAFADFSRRYIFWFPLSIQAGCTALLFIYIGYMVGKLLRNSDFKELKKSHKTAVLVSEIVLTLVALCLAIHFIMNFKRFWLVHSDMGKGVLDILGSLSASGLVLLISYGISRLLKNAGFPLEYIGRNSLYFLMGHVIELTTFPWHRWIPVLTGVEFGMPHYYSILVIGKMIWVTGFMIVAAVLADRVRRE